MTKNIVRNIALFCGMVLTGLLMVSAVEAAEKKKRDPGKKVYMRNTCLACHGRNGAKAIMDYPNLAGQDVKYMINQINYIISGKRLGRPDATGNPRSSGMRGALVPPGETKSSLTKAQIKQVATWLSKQEPAKLKAPKTPLDPASVEAGKKLYKKRCRACHGKEGKKPLKGNPIVAGQKRDYLLIQLEDIKSKARKTPKTGAMLNVVKKLDDTQLGSLADYLSQVER